MVVGRITRKATIKVPPSGAGALLLDYLAHRFTYQNRDEWRRCILEGQVLLDGKCPRTTAILNAGHTLTYLPPQLQEPAVDTRFRIVYEDEGMLVIEKPANLPSHPSGRYFQNTLLTLLRNRPGLQSATLVNRIDRETSGLVLAAKDRRHAGHLNDQFKRNTVYKRYVALVEGEFPPGPVDVKGWLGADLEGPVRKKQRFFMEGAPGGTPQDGKACRTVLRRIRFRGGISEVEAFPLTGRLHQIRATLLAMGYPVVGDKLYGVDDTLFLRFIKGAVSQEDWNRLRLPRQALHAAEIRVTHPTTGALMVFQSSVPSDMEDFMTG